MPFRRISVLPGCFSRVNTVLLKKMVADFYEVDLSTINRYISQYEEELKYNGYFLCRGKLLKELKLQFGHVINEMTKTTQLGLFSFRAVLNMGMLLTESEKAKQVRARIIQTRNHPRDRQQ